MRGWDGMEGKVRLLNQQSARILFVNKPEKLQQKEREKYMYHDIEVSWFMN